MVLSNERSDWVCGDTLESENESTSERATVRATMKVRASEAHYCMCTFMKDSLLTKGKGIHTEHIWHVNVGEAKPWARLNGQKQKKWWGGHSVSRRLLATDPSWNPSDPSDPSDPGDPGDPGESDNSCNSTTHGLQSGPQWANAYRHTRE